MKKKNLRKLKKVIIGLKFAIECEVRLKDPLHTFENPLCTVSSITF